LFVCVLFGDKVEIEICIPAVAGHVCSQLLVKQKISNFEKLIPLRRCKREYWTSCRSSSHLKRKSTTSKRTRRSPFLESESPTQTPTTDANTIQINTDRLKSHFHHSS
jgi:hypothetical protein